MTINISEPLNQEMRDYIEKNGLTITTFLHLAITKYLENQKEVKKIKNMFTELLNEQLKKELKGKEY